MANILNVYDTSYGNTLEIAEYFNGYLARKNHAVITASIDEIPDEIIQKTDFFIIGCPTHYWRPTRKMIGFITRLFRLRVYQKNALVYDTRLANIISGSAANKMAKMLASLRFQNMSKGEWFCVEGVKGPLRLGEVHKCEMLAARVISYLEGLGIENLHTPGFVL